jgi:hypothetical protein
LGCHEALAAIIASQSGAADAPLAVAGQVGGLSSPSGASVGLKLSPASLTAPLSALQQSPRVSPSLLSTLAAPRPLAPSQISAACDQTALPPLSSPLPALLAPFAASPAAAAEPAARPTTTLGRLSAELPGAAPQPSDLTGSKDRADRTFQLKLGGSEGALGVDAGGSGATAETAALPSSEKLNFIGVAGRDVYNPTAPFSTRFRGRDIRVMAARVEPRSSESSEAMFFEKAGERWRPLPGAPVFKLQDPFVSKVGNDLVVGGVETYPREGGGLGYRTVFYRGQDLAGLQRFAQGPDGMKDIRLLQLPDGKILVLTRPQGQVGGRGKIAMTMISNLESLGPEAIGRAKVFEELFPPDEWGGANEMHLLKNGLVGVLGHTASFDEKGGRHYYPMAFAIDPATGRRWPMRILLKRSQIPKGASKRPDLEDVLFSGGLVRREGGTAELSVGAGDAEVYRVSIPDPFADFENSSR